VTRVDFYILQDVDANAACRFACRLAVKALAGGNPVHIHTDPEAAAEMDELLWHYPEHRFVPHELDQAGKARLETPLSTPLLIGSNPPAEADGVLINLASAIPTFFGRFERVAEIIVGANRPAGRERYKFYRDRGYPLFDHHLDDWEVA
jgi:DNA polymerase III subunit chi